MTCLSAVYRVFRCAPAIVLVLSALVPSSAAEPDSFENATRAPYRPAEEKSRNGRSIAEMKKKVEEVWPTIVFEKDGKPVPQVVTLTTDVGEITIELWADVAPNHARSFLALTQARFFDGLIFHRCIPGFVIQGGCPVGNGTGGPGYCLKPEFNDRPHVRGVLSMARAQPEDSAGSQFFICVDEARFLDGKYTAFGKVLDGMDVVDKIVSAPRGFNDRPDNPVTIKSAKIRVRKAD